MAREECRHCGHDVATGGEACPECGAPDPAESGDGDESETSGRTGVGLERVRERREKKRRFRARAAKITGALLLCGILVWGVHSALRPPAPDTAADLTPQDANFLHPPDTIERYLAERSFTLDTLRGIRSPGDSTVRTTMRFDDGTRLPAKWTLAPRGGEGFNAAPRYEEAAYRLQKLFLEQAEYVVPPTACRCVPVEVYSELDSDVRPTFDGSGCVLVTIQSWLWAVTDEDVFDRERFRRDTAYARHLANLDVLTHLIDHRDANPGNFLVSTLPDRPRVFAVDNGVAFDSRGSIRGRWWRKIRVARVPEETGRRLRELDRSDLRSRLATVAQFERRQREGMVRVEPGEPLDRDEGIRRREGVLQIGLTEEEIDDVHDRLQDLIERIEDGDIGTF